MEEIEQVVETEVETHSTSLPDTTISDEISLWERIRRWLLPTAAERAERYTQRLAVLDETIAIHPQAASGYVLRGELHYQFGLYELAAADFQQALVLAERQLETEDWGVVTQAMLERAQTGLKRAMRY